MTIVNRANLNFNEENHRALKEKKNLNRLIKRAVIIAMASRGFCTHHAACNHATAATLQHRVATPLGSFITAANLAKVQP